MNIFLDIETIPTQRDDTKTRFMDKHKAAHATREPPLSITGLKDAAKREQRLAAWNAKIADETLEAAEEEWRRTALDGGYGELCVIGWAVDDGPVQTLVRMTLDDPERDLLAQFFAHLRGEMDNAPNQTPVFCGHNIPFDLKFLHHRAVVLRVKPPFWIPHNAAVFHGKYWDSMYEWCGLRDRVKLTDLCDMLGIEVHDTIDGSGVWDAYAAGDVATVEEHCRADVERVRQVYQRLTWQD